jgi:ribosomal-protein-alanine acetyltransferase
MIRRFLPTDAESVAHLFAQTPEAAHWSAQSLVQLGTVGSQLWVATKNEGEVIGAIAWRDIAGEAEILNLAVESTHRRRGIGRQLMHAALDEIAARGATRVFLEVRESNLSAQLFYRQFGFSQDGRRRNYYSDPAEDAMLLSRPVRGSAPQTP